mgnify:CR=1 FL=1
MSGPYRAVHWNRQKKVYDRWVVGGLLIAIGTFIAVTGALRPEFTAETLIIRSTSIAAVVLLHIVLAIGPLARLDRRFMPFLYNRRHLGVTIFLLGLTHASMATFQFHAFGDVNPLVSIFTAYSRDYAALGDLARISNFPFEPFGVLALSILFVMAATSHDFWLRNLGASFWKLIHIFVYVAYGSVLIHVAYGVLQSERGLAGPVLLGAGFVTLFTLHFAAERKEARIDAVIAPLVEEGYAKVCAVSLLRDGEGRPLRAGKERVAVFLSGARVYALSNACRHQGGPIGEGKILDGCITCPWHGWQYEPENGKSPPPFEEVIGTYPVRVVDGDVYVLPRFNELGSSCPGAGVEGGTR